MNDTELESLIVKLGGDADDFQKMLGDAVQSTLVAGQSMDQLIDSATNLVNTMNKASGGTFTDAIDKATIANLIYTQAMQAGAEVTESVITDAEKYSKEIERLNNLLALGAISQETFNRAAEKASAPLIAAAEAAEKAMLDQVSATVKAIDEQDKAAMKAAADQEAATQKQVEQALKLIDAHDKAMAKRGQEVTEAAFPVTAAQKYADKVKEVNQLLKEGAISQETFNKTVQNLKSERFGALSNQVKTFGKNLTLYATAPLAGLMVPLTHLSSMAAVIVRDFAEEEAATTRLSAALAANGRNVQQLLPEYKAFATQMQSLTTTSDELAIDMIQTAESMGLTGEQAKRAVKNAIAMQASFDVDAHAAIRMTSALERGNAVMLSRYIPTLRGMKDHAAQAALAQELLAKSFSVAEAQTHTITGSLQVMKNSISEIKERFGEVAADALRPMIAGIKSLSEWFQKADDDTIKWIAIIGGIVAAAGPVILILNSIVGAAVSLYGILGVAGAAILKFVGIVQFAVAISGGWSVALGALISPIGLAVVALAALTAGIMMYNSAVQEQKENELKGAEIESKTKLKLADYALLAERIRINNKLAEEGKAPRWADPHSGLTTLEMPKKESSIADFKAIDDFTKKLREQVETWGMSADQAHLYKLAVDGVAAAELQEAEALVKEKEHLELVKKRNTAVDAFTKHLNDQAAAIGKSTDELKLHELATMGVSEAQIEALRNQAKDVEEKKKATETAKDLAKDTKAFITHLDSEIEAFGKGADEVKLLDLAKRGMNDTDRKAIETSLAKLKSLKDHAKEMEKGKELTKKYMTPQQKFFEGQDELKTMLDHGAISIQTYTQGLHDLEKQAHKDYTANVKVSGVEGALKGSADAMARLEEFRSGMASLPSTFKRPLPAVTGPAAPPELSQGAQDRMTAMFEEAGQTFLTDMERAGQTVSGNDRLFSDVSGSVNRLDLSTARPDIGSPIEKNPTLEKVADASLDSDKLFHDIAAGIDRLVAVSEEIRDKETIEFEGADLE